MYPRLSYNEIQEIVNQDGVIVHYQPQFCLRTGVLAGAEALVRLKSGDQVYYPGSFIEKVEKDKELSNAIASKVMKEAVKAMLEYKRVRDRFLTVAVNFGVYQLADPSIVADVLDLLLDASVPPKFFKVEVTEAAASHQLSKVKRVLEGLKLGGCSIAIDDFGSGYSTFSYLRVLPVDTVKLDMSLAKHIPGSAPDVELCKGLIRLSEELGIEVVAEGVETREQHDFFRKVMVDVGQGYFYSKPVEFEEVIQNKAGVVS